MPVYLLDERLLFPPPEEYEGDVVAIGGGLEPERLMLAYSMGIFPWYNPGDEIMWWCPRWRSVLPTGRMHISHSLRNTLNKDRFTFTMDTCFEEVMHRCGVAGDRASATWIHADLEEAYGQLHRMGVAHSVETWMNGQLVGGLYGVSLGRMFCGESMFAEVKDSSKAALARLCNWLRNRGFEWIDCQVQNDHLASLGATEIERSVFLQWLEGALSHETLRGPWHF